MSRCKQAYIEYESQSKAIRSQPLPKRKIAIAIARRLPSGKKQRLQCLREAKSNGHLDRAILILRLLSCLAIKGSCFVF
jgi:hypothetical protein